MFRVAYRTVEGESLWLEVESVGVRCELPMRWADADHWELEIEGDFTPLRYGYLCKRDGMVLREPKRREWVWQAGSPPPLQLLFRDDWRSAGSEDRVYQAKVFEAAGDGARALGSSEWEGKSHEFLLQMALLPEGLVPCVIGGHEALGGWDYARALPMVEVSENLWRAEVRLPTGERMEYKYGFYGREMWGQDVATTDWNYKSQPRAVRLEDGANRVLSPCEEFDHVVVSDECFRRSEDLRFRGAGVAIPVFSLRSGAGCGVGEFADLKGMGDWAMATGLKMIQILPINDTTSSRIWTDSYPYSAISVFALHPLYLRLDAMSHAPVNGVALTADRKRLNALKDVDYEAVIMVKWRVTREIFDKHHDTILRDAAFLAFLKRNRDWVLDYAVFSVKRDEYGTADFSKWGEWAVYDAKRAEALTISSDVMYYIWLQYELDLQLVDAVAHLRSIGIALKGDLPIGVDRDSVDAWVCPHLFKMGAQAGAPPDAFAVKGQNWGFPTYDWEEMKKDGYAWWRGRFAKLSGYFDAYRIDHILGFFRIWQVPHEHVEGIMGWFDPALPVQESEFEEYGIEFDHERFCTPYIHRKNLEKTFGDLADAVARDFMMEKGAGLLMFREEYASQRKIVDFFAKLGTGDWSKQDWLRSALLDLAAEVLFHEAGEGEFHPRMSMADTDSFKALDRETQSSLLEIYMDYFFRRQEDFWEAQAMEKLPVMRGASEMLLCGEDLGMVPACVPGVMQRLGILSLEIQRWPKDSGKEFSHPAQMPYMSVATTGTHDMSTLRGWWREDEMTRARYFWEMFGKAFPEEELAPETARDILAQHLCSPAMWAIFPLQDLLAMDADLRSPDIEGERINVPAISPFYWRWRMEVSIEKLACAEGFNAKLAQMVTEAGR
jgi:4-alpha-glucanotransferase